MGNHSSRVGNISQRQIVEADPQRAHSFPRNLQRNCQHKVLPDGNFPKKLRPTNNGEILQSGGTLTGRHQNDIIALDHEANFSALQRHNNPSLKILAESKSARSYLAYYRDPLHRSAYRYGGIQADRNIQRDHIKKFGSEPDLRETNFHCTGTNTKEKLKGKKKYKAPPPPNVRDTQAEKRNVEFYLWNTNVEDEKSVRRERLFKSRTEVKTKSSSPTNYSKTKLERNPVSDNLHNDSDVDNVPLRYQQRNEADKKYNRLSLPILQTDNSVPEFQAELKEATRKLRNIRPTEESLSSEQELKSKLKTLDHDINKKENMLNKIKQIQIANDEGNLHGGFKNVRGQPSGKESSPEQMSPQLCQKLKQKEVPSKIFYFGMEQEREEYFDCDIINQFTSSLNTRNINSSESEISSDVDINENHASSSDGIALQLRPILPKKQLEIPRFSPAAAWRLLSAIESNAPPSTVASDDNPVMMEDRIENLSRPLPPPICQAGPRSSHDKSGDSGISGDAGPTGFDDVPDITIDSNMNIQLPPVYNKAVKGISWTPQQDLGEEETSTEDEDISNRNIGYQKSPVKFTPRPNVFSLSLPRENHINSYSSSPNKKDLGTNTFLDQSDNWFFSKSAPNSLNNGFNSLEIRRPRTLRQQQNTSSMARLMYLPELHDGTFSFKQNKSRRGGRSRYKEQETTSRSKSADNSKEAQRLSLLSKSCESVWPDKLCLGPENLQDPPEPERSKYHKPKRFAFQSTIRQIERKRIAEKLSKEAERKEQQRLSELQAMQKVEEEFQRKRAREKASIRQQLRLFSLEDTFCSSLPPNLDGKEDLSVRQEPDGAVSSSTSSPMISNNKINSKLKNKYNRKGDKPKSMQNLTSSSDSSDENRVKAPMTQILSEYRQNLREYKDFRGSPRYLKDHADNFAKQTTVYPQVTCNMPKAKEKNKTDNNSNYRKQFARGAKTNKPASIHSEDSQSNKRNYSPKIYHSKKCPISR